MTDAKTSSWQWLDPARQRGLNTAIEQTHQAVQFISMLGKHYLEHQSDDSHTNMGWLNAQQALSGRWIDAPKTRFCLALKTSELKLVLYNNQFQVIDQLTLNGLTSNAATVWLKEQLKQLNLDPALFQMDLHYEIPDYGSEKDFIFKLEDQQSFFEASAHRANSDLLLTLHTASFENASEVRTWPHHFDHGSYIPLHYQNGEPSHSIGIGMAIPDEVIGKPYYYVTQWSNEIEIDYASALGLSDGVWQEQLNGAVLPANKLLTENTADAQFRLVNQFMQEGIEASLQLLKLK